MVTPGVQERCDFRIQLDSNCLEPIAHSLFVRWALLLNSFSSFMHRAFTNYCYNFRQRLSVKRRTRLKACPPIQGGA